MKIQYKFGDLFASDEKVLVHGTNKMGIMGSGCAKLMKEKHPEAFRAYFDAYEVYGLRLGQVVWAESKGLLIGNAITQERFGRDKRTVYVSYDAIRTAMREVNEKVAGVHSTVGLPQVGAGLAHGDWNIIAPIIEAEAKDFAPVVYVIDAFIHNSLKSTQAKQNQI